MLEIANLITTTITSIQQQLKHDLCVDLSQRTHFIYKQVNLYLQQKKEKMW